MGLDAEKRSWKVGVKILMQFPMDCCSCCRNSLCGSGFIEQLEFCINALAIDLNKQNFCEIS